MHKTTRQLWTSSSSCLFCDFQILATSRSSARGSKHHTRGKSDLALALPSLHQPVQWLPVAPLNLALTHPKQPSDVSTPLASPLTRLFRLKRQHGSSYCYSTKSHVRNHGSKPSSLELCLGEGHGMRRSSRSLSGGIHQNPAAQSSHAGSSTIVTRTHTRSLSTSILSPISSAVEGEVASLSFSSTALTSQSFSTPTFTTPALEAKTVIGDNSSNFELFFPKASSSLGSAIPERAATSDATPWRLKSMGKGSLAEERVRKLVYERARIESWWPLYKEISETWQGGSVQPNASLKSALVRADFIRFVRALKVSQHPDRVQMLEILFDDFHLAVEAPKSNVRVYCAFIETLHFWKMDNLTPVWIDRIKSRITSPLPNILINRQDTQEQFHDLMRVLAMTNQAEPMMIFLEELKQGALGPIRPTTKIYDTTIEVFLRKKDIPMAMKMFHEIKDQGLEPQLTTFNTLLRGHLENKDARSAQRVLESLLLTDIRPDIYTFNLLMTGYLEMGEFESVNGFYKGLGEYGLMPNAKTYRILMKSYLKQGHVDQVLDLFFNLKQSSKVELHPGPEDYRVLVHALASNGRMPDALKVLEEMRSNKVQVKTSVYDVFLTEYARQGEVDMARRILDGIIAERMPLLDGSFNTLIGAYLAQNDYEKVSEITELMNQYGIHTSNTTFNIMINSAKSTGNLEGAMKLYERMKTEGVRPDVWTFNTLLGLLVEKLTPQATNVKRKGDADAVTAEQIEEYVPQIEALLQEMKTKGIKPDVVTYGNLIRQYVILNDIEQAEMLFHEMVKSGMSPNGYIFNTLMNGFTLIQEMGKAVELFRRMPKYGVEPDATTFTTLVKGYTNMHQYDRAQDFANSLQQNPRIELDKHCIHTLMQLAQKSQQPGMALDFLEMLRGRGMEPDRVTFTVLINALSRSCVGPFTKGSGQSRRNNRRGGYPQVEPTLAAVESILSIIEQDGYPLHHSEITTMISAYCRLGRPLAALEFFKTSYWRGSPKMSAANCGALFHGLLAPEQGRRFDGVVLNLYTRMLTGTRDMLRAEAERRPLKEDKEPLEEERKMTTEAQDTSPWTSSTSFADSTALSRAATKAPKSTFRPYHDLPHLDLVTMGILFNSFGRQQNWKMVLQLWQDLESIGAENLYPYEMPLELLGRAAQAYHMVSKDSGKVAEPSLDSSLSSSSATTVSDGQRQETNSEKCDKLLRRLWAAHHWMGAEWSVKIYGYNVFESLSPLTASASSSSPPSLSPAFSATRGPGGGKSPLSTSASWAPTSLNSFLSSPTSHDSFNRERSGRVGRVQEEKGGSCGGDDGEEKLQSRT